MDPKQNFSLKLDKNDKGKCVIAEEDIPNNSYIVQFIGDIYDQEDYEELVDIECDRFLPIGNDLYIGPSFFISDYINHSCQPNCGVKFNDDEVYLISIRDIKKGEEICFDYSTLYVNDPNSIKCLCGSKNCRGEIGNFEDIPYDVRSNYIMLGIVPDFILEQWKQLQESRSI